MTFFKKTSVAVLLTTLIVALCCVWGYSRAYEDVPTEHTGADRSAGESNLNYYLGWIDDDANLFSVDTTDELARDNLVLDTTYGTILAIKTVDYLNGIDIRTYTEEQARTAEIGSRDLLLLLDTNTKNWYVASGSTMTSYVESSAELPALFREHLDAAFWSDGDPDAAILALFDDLEDWCKANLPEVQNSGSSFFQGDGAIKTITMGAIFSGILLNVMANLWWIVLLLIGLTIVDRFRFEKHYTRYPPGTNPAPMFHPFLFWHRTGSNWYERMMDEFLAEEEDDEDDEDDPEDDEDGPGGYRRPGGYRPPEDDGFRRGPGYSTDPNEPGPFGPRTDPGTPPPEDLPGQFLRLLHSVSDLLQQVISSIPTFIRSFFHRL